MKPKKLECLEGVRALACISVVFSHLWGAFLPGSHLLEKLSHTPLFILYSGNTPLRILFVLSGFVLCYKYFSTGQTKSLQKDTVKRYLRLALPVAFVTLTVCAMMKLRLLYHVPAAEYTGSQSFLAIFNQFQPKFWTALREGLWGSMFEGGSSYVGPMWTMTYELLGSYLVFAVVAILRNKRARYLFYLVFLLAFSNYYSYFILGMLICDLYTQEEPVNRFLLKHGGLALILHAAAWLYIGKVSNMDVFRWKSLLFALAVAVMFLTLLNHPLLDRLWGNRAGVFIGKHGFSIYLIHWPVIESLGSAYLCLLMGAGYGLKPVILTDIVLILAAVLALSTLFTQYIVLPSGRLSDRVAAWVLKEKQ